MMHMTGLSAWLISKQNRQHGQHAGQLALDRVETISNKPKRSLLGVLLWYVGFALLWISGNSLLIAYRGISWPDAGIFFAIDASLFVILSCLLLFGMLNGFFAVYQTQNAQLKESEQTLIRVLEGSELGFWDWHIQKNEVIRNAIWAEMLGYSFAEIEFTTQQWSDFVHPDDCETAWQSINAVLTGQAEKHELIYRMKTKSGEYKWILDRARVVEYDASGQPLRMSGTHTDVDQSQHTELALQESEKRFRSIFENAAVGIAQVNEAGEFLVMNDTFCRIIGYSRSELLAEHKTFQAITFPDDLVRDLEFFQQLLTNKIQHYELEKRYVCKNGSIAWVKLSVSALRDSSGKFSTISAIQDITPQKRLQAELEYQAHIDYLTDVANRRHFMELAEREMSRTLRYQQSLAIVMLDIDYFKRVNDEYGHKAGDRVLQIFTTIIRTILRDTDIIGRLGGEEFAILLPQTTADGALEIAQRLQNIINNTRMSVAANTQLRITVSMGIAGLTEQDNSIDRLLSTADDRLYRAKSAGRNRIISE